MKKIKNLTTLLLYLLMATALQVFGQEESGNPKSPKGNDFSELFKKVSSGSNDLPIGLSTGTPNITIPIGSVSCGALSVPVFLSYSTSGVKVRELPGLVGTSWKLNAGGVITREIRGWYSDIEPYGFNNTGSSINKDMSTSTVNNIWNGPTNFYDPEPDIFYFNFCGHSGKFMFDNTLNGHSVLRTVPYSNLRIEYTSENDEFTEFVITDENGVRYIFNEIEITKIGETASNYSDRETSWYLTKVQSADLNDEITLTYNQTNTTFNSGPVFFVEGSTRWGEYPTTYRTDNCQIKEQPHELASISSRTASMTFTIVDADDKPYYSSKYRILKKIAIADMNNKPIRQFDFNYQYSNQKRFFLHTITESNADGTLAKPPYQFEYDNISLLPDYRSYNIDFWGYYTQEPNPTPKANSTLIPRLSPSDINVGYRFPNFQYTKLGMLTKITYPDGGSTSFDYESNTYAITGNVQWKNILTDCGFNYNFNNVEGAGVRVSKIQTADGVNNQITTFGYDDGNAEFNQRVSYGSLSKYPVHKYLYYYKIGDQPYEMGILSSNAFGLYEGQVNYSKVIVYSGGETGNTRGVNGKVVNNFLVGVPYPCANCGHWTQNNYFYDLTNYNSDSTGLLSSTEIYDKDNVLRKTVNNDYKIEDVPNKQPFYGLKAEASDDNWYNDFYWGVYQIPYRRVKLNKTTETNILSTMGQQIKTETNYTYNERCQVVSTTIHDSQGNTLLTEYKHPTDNLQLTNTPAEVITQMVQKNIISPVLQTETFKNTQRIGGQITNFKLYGSLIVPASIEVLEGNVYVTKVVFEEYDGVGNLVQTLQTGGIRATSIMGYDNTIPIASVTNTHFWHAAYTSFEPKSHGNWEYDESKIEPSADAVTGDYVYHSNANIINQYPLPTGDYIVSWWGKTNENNTFRLFTPTDMTSAEKIQNYKGWTYYEVIITMQANTKLTINCNGADFWLDELRLYPKDAFMTTTSYRPLIGKTAEVDANNLIIYYEYDELGRLVRIKDQDGNIRKGMIYNYKH